MLLLKALNSSMAVPMTDFGVQVRGNRRYIYLNGIIVSYKKVVPEYLSFVKSSFQPSHGNSGFTNLAAGDSATAAFRLRILGAAKEPTEHLIRSQYTSLLKT